jgi:hypothetical protein
MDSDAPTMSTANADRWKTVAGQIRSNATWCAIGSAWFGLETGAAVWRPRDPFYPYSLIFWGVLTVVSVRRALVHLNELSYTVPLAVANERKKEARSLIPYIFCTALTSFCFALCIVAIRPFGTLYAVGAAALGVLTVSMLWTTERKIKYVAQGFYRSADESRT